MKKILLSAVSLAILSGSALAADLPSRKAPVAPPPPPPPMWTGFYAGLNLGGGWSGGNGNSNAYNLDGLNGGITNNIGANGNSGGVIGGAQIGYNYQINSLGLGGMGVLIGAEADFQGTSMGSSGGGSRYGYLINTANNGTTRYVPGWVGGGSSIPWFGTVRGRLGLTVMPTLLIYGTGGFAYADVQRNGGNQNSATQTGWTAGGGAEWMFMPNWSAKVEYLYTDVSGGNSGWGNNLGVSLNSVNNHTRWNTVRAGVNYHFNWGAAPVVAKY
jgi:outer membrane immunogenic protein